jgi:hypothetical protein
MIAGQARLDYKSIRSAPFREEGQAYWLQPLFLINLRQVNEILSGNQKSGRFSSTYLNVTASICIRGLDRPAPISIFCHNLLLVFAPSKPVKGFPVRTGALTCFGYMFDGGKEVNTFCLCLQGLTKLQNWHPR